MIKDSLRISITQKCNLNCPYCHKEGQKNEEKEMTLEKIKEISKEAKKLGVKKIKITGGEPLLRIDIIEIIDAFKNFEDVSLVTNGMFLKEYAKKLKLAGLKRINIGCDSIKNPNLKNKKKIISGIMAAKKSGITKIKINMVVLKGINENEIKEMISFAKKAKATLQLIELVKTDEEFYKKHYYPLIDIEKYLESKAIIITQKEMQNRRLYTLPEGTIEVIRPFHNNFCENCKRVRITSGGMIKTCLLKNDNLTIFSKESLEKAIKGEIINDRY